MLTTAILIATWAWPISAMQPTPVELYVQNKSGQKRSFAVESRLVVESRFIGLQTFIPEQIDFRYRSTMDVVKDGADGIVDIRYRRPTITQIEAETSDEPAKTKTERLNWDFTMKLSPINEVLDVKDNAKRTTPPPQSARWVATHLFPESAPRQDAVSAFIGELYRLSLFVGSIDSSLEFQPKLNFDAVKPGDTWKRTVSYTPQTLKSKGNRVAMQRLDTVYTYQGLRTVNGRSVHRVSAETGFSTDMLPYLKQNTEDPEGELNRLKEIKFDLKATIEFDLDINTRQTRLASARSTGGFRVVGVDNPDDPLLEQRLTGRTTLRPETPK